MMHLIIKNWKKRFLDLNSKSWIIERKLLCTDKTINKYMNISFLPMHHIDSWIL